MSKSNDFSTVYINDGRQAAANEAAAARGNAAMAEAQAYIAGNRAREAQELAQKNHAESVRRSEFMQGDINWLRENIGHMEWKQRFDYQAFRVRGNLNQKDAKESLMRLDMHDNNIEKAFDYIDNLRKTHESSLQSMFGLFKDLSEAFEEVKPGEGRIFLNRFVHSFEHDFNRNGVLALNDGAAVREKFDRLLTVEEKHSILDIAQQFDKRMNYFVFELGLDEVIKRSANLDNPLTGKKGVDYTKRMELKNLHPDRKDEIIDYMCNFRHLHHQGLFFDYLSSVEGRKWLLQWQRISRDFTKPLENVDYLIQTISQEILGKVDLLYKVNTLEPYVYMAMKTDFDDFNKEYVSDFNLLTLKETVKQALAHKNELPLLIKNMPWCAYAKIQTHIASHEAGEKKLAEEVYGVMIEIKDYIKEAIELTNGKEDEIKMCM